MNEAQAKALIAEAQAWFSAIAISPVKQALWAEALMGVRGLTVADVRSALRAIATREKPSGEFWSLEISEILSVSKAEMRRRREREEQDLSRPAIAARSEPHPDDERRAELAREVMRGLVAKVTERLPRVPRGETGGGPTQTLEEANARRDELRRQAEAPESEVAR